VPAQLANKPTAVLVAELERDHMRRQLKHVEREPAEPISAKIVIAELTV
jgi:hypothetical protein